MEPPIERSNPFIALPIALRNGQTQKALRLFRRICFRPLTDVLNTTLCARVAHLNPSTILELKDEVIVTEFSNQVIRFNASPDRYRIKAPVLRESLRRRAQNLLDKCYPSTALSLSQNEDLVRASSRQIEEVELRLALTALLGQMDSVHYQILDLALFFKYTNEEIAERLGQTTEEVKSMRAEALSQLRRRLSDRSRF